MKKYLDNKFWLDFIDKNENFSKTCVIKDSFTDEDKKTLYEGVTEVLYTRIKGSILDKGFRLYLDGQEADRLQTSKLLLENPPEVDEDIIAYCKRSFDTKFGIIMNNNEAFSESIASRVYEMINPLFEIAGIPPLGNEITVFIGNYGWTPLGIHKDHIGENVIHFHLGPGRKQMYIWDDDTYEKLVGKNVSNNKDIEPILSHSKKFDFGERDMFYMPWYENHVGYTEEISIGLSLWFQSTDNYTYSKKILEFFVSQFLPKDKKIIPPQIDYLHNHDTYDKFKNIVFDSIDNKESSLDDFLKKIYLDFKYTLISNGTWANLPIENNIEELELDFLEGKFITITKPFKIIHQNHNKEKMYIFVRGNRLSIKYFKDVSELIEKLNTNESISVDGVIKNITIPKEAFLYVILILYKFKGITVSEF